MTAATTRPFDGDSEDSDADGGVKAEPLEEGSLRESEPPSKREKKTNMLAEEEFDFEPATYDVGKKCSRKGCISTI